MQFSKTMDLVKMIMVEEWRAIGRDVANALSLAREMEAIRVNIRAARSQEEARSHSQELDEYWERVSKLRLLGSIFHTFTASFYSFHGYKA